MKHFLTTSQYDTYINPLETTRDYESIEHQCKMCGLKPGKIFHQEYEKLVLEIKNRPLYLPAIIDLHMDQKRYLYEETEKRYEKLDTKNQKCPGILSSVVKTRDADFCGFLVENGYNIVSSVPLGREKAEASASSESNTHYGFWSGTTTKTRSSFRSEGERRDVIEFVLQKK